MARETWTLTDVDRDVYTASLRLGADDLGGGLAGASVVKRTLRGGLRDGVDVIEVDTGAIRFSVVPTRGMGLWRIWCGETAIGWKSPVRGPVHPAFVRMLEGNGIGWLDGFDELFVRCGLAHNGPPEVAAGGQVLAGLHGRIANIPAHRVEITADADSGELAVYGEVDEAQLFGPKLRLATSVRTQAGSTSLTVTDTVTNLSAEPGEMELLYHINVGVPLLEPGAKVFVPFRKMAPRDATSAGRIDQWDAFAAATPGVPEAAYYFDPLAGGDGLSRALLQNASGEVGFSVAFPVAQLPRFVLWKNPQDPADGYVSGLEPAVNFPNPKSFEREQGRVLELAAGESRSFTLTLQAHSGSAAVAAARDAIAEIQRAAKPEILAKPDPHWSPV